MERACASAGGRCSFFASCGSRVSACEEALQVLRPVQGAASQSASRQLCRMALTPDKCDAA
eukprot:4604272-Pleurochrysis_carterae.AAC.3